MRILVLGSTGYVGKNLIPRLLGNNHQVRCLIRNPNALLSDTAEVIYGDATDQSKVMEAAAGCDRIIYLIHSMSAHSDKFEEIDQKIANNVARAAKDAGVRQIIYLGGLGKKGISQTPHLRSRHEVGQILRSSGIPVIELRAAVIIGSGSASFEMIRALVKRLPVMICPKWVRIKTQPISIDDVLEYFSRILNETVNASKTLDIGGSDILSYRDMMLTVARQMGLRRLIIPVPVLTPWLSSHWVNLVTSVSAPLARALIESVKSETICENKDALQLYDFRPIGFEEAVRRALYNYR
jgi:uncharacterized protein YbjT (DUF2867 family)